MGEVWIDIAILFAFTLVTFTTVIEIILVARVYQTAPEVVALRERLIAASCRAVGIGGFMGLLINRLFFDALSADAIAVIGAISVVILAIPSMRFLRLYLVHGFAPQQPPR